MLVATVSISDVVSFKSSATVVIFAMLVAAVLTLEILDPTVLIDLLAYLVFNA